MPRAALDVLRQALGMAMVCINVLEPERNGQGFQAGTSPYKYCGMDTLVLRGLHQLRGLRV